MPKLKRRDILEDTDPASYSKGLRYFEQDRVKSLDVEKIDDDLIKLTATVQGNASSPYKQKIFIDGLDEGLTSIEGECTCPMGFNCKHVVAACLKYQSAPDQHTKNANQCLNWLEKFIESGQVNSASGTDTEFLAYILSFSHSANELSVKFVRTHPLKKGGLSKGRNVLLDNLTNMYFQRTAMLPIDEDIVRLVEAQNMFSWGVQDYTLGGELGYLALTKILSTQRCFWQETNGAALYLGEARDLKLTWAVNDKGNYRLQLDIQPTAIALNTTPALYLDLKSGAIGLLRGADFNAKQWALLMSAPEVPTNALTEFSRQIITRLPAVPLPPPGEIQTESVSGEPTQPRLFLFSERIDNNQRVHMARLRFAYAGHELSYRPTTPVCNIYEENRVIQIQRDLDTEASAMEKLIAQGFQLYNKENLSDLVFFSPGTTSVEDSAARWQQFMEQSLPELQAQGWEVEFDPSFQLRFVDVDDWEIEVESENEWFDLHFDLNIQGRKLPLLPLVAEILTRYEPQDLPDMVPVSLGDHQYLRLPRKRIQPVIQILYELFDAGNLDQNGGMRLSRFDAARLADLEQDYRDDVQWRGGKAMRELGRKLKDFQGITPAPPPAGLKATLRPYQKQGLNWLQFLRGYQFNGILADDMGLGKTVQTLAHLLLEKEQGRMDKPCLIIAPTSLMSNWRREAQVFTPALKVLILQGHKRQQHFASIDQADLVVSTYPLLVRDESILLEHEYHTLILDEAQVIKNPRSKSAQVARRIQCRHRLCLTGTPMENHLGELWALFDFLMPGFLGSNPFFKKHFRNPIENRGDNHQRERLVRRVSPFMLRRRKSDVVKELPEKTEIIRSVALDDKQAALYESIRLSMEKRVREAIAQKGLARSHITVLDALLKLRQTCCDPQLLPLTEAKKVTQSAKLEMLMDMLPELIEEGRRILLFSQFTKMLSIIEQRLINAGISYTKLTGQTQNRDRVIETFRAGEVNIFLISLKAGGVGLNLTEADTVIHYDPWWNPAAENQATDRAHRIGQNKAVFVYKLITENTVEEKILAMQEHKQALADSVYQKGRKNTETNLSQEDLQSLFAPLV